MALNMNTSVSMALSFAGSFPRLPSVPPRGSSLIMNRPQSVFSFTSSKMEEVPGQTRPRSVCPNLYKGISDRPLGWKPRRVAKPTASRTANLKRWDGAARASTEWDALRKDPELWFPNGDCLVHLYGRGQSVRGASFRLPFDLLVEAGCRPLLEKFLVWDGSPSSDSSYNGSEYFERSGSSAKYELYMPAPPSAQRGQAMFYHIATRNFFAWVCGRSLVGPHLGGALVGLLNSMNEFRCDDVENEMDILDYMDEEGYSDMRSAPSHALAILYFAEHFQFRDVWIDAFAHCTGMHDLLSNSSEFEPVSRLSKALMNRARREMDVRVQHCSEQLSVWLEDELSSAYLGLSPGHRAHLDRFRSFLHSYYVEKFGYYPPNASQSGSGSFSKADLCTMRYEFEMLYDFLADETFTSSDPQRFPTQDGFCVLQNIQALDKRRRNDPLPFPLPLLPEDTIPPLPPKSFTKRMTWRGIQPDKMQLDPRLASLASMSKATNRYNEGLLTSPLVRAYRGFEKQVIFGSTKTEKAKITATDARKVRWIMIYAVLQNLRTATDVPDEVRDIENVPYHLCVLTAGCPPWKDGRPYSTFLRTQTEQMKDDWRKSAGSNEDSSPVSSTDEHLRKFSFLKPDIDHRPVSARMNPTTGLFAVIQPPTPRTRTGTIRRALSTLGNMPELRHPKPVRSSFHEILVHGYGNGLNVVSVSSNDVPEAIPEAEKEKEDENAVKLSEDTVSSRWSKTDSDSASVRSSTNGNESRRGSDASLGKEVLHMLEVPLSEARSGASSSYGEDAHISDLQPEPLQLTGKNDTVPADSLLITKVLSVENEKADEELLANPELYLYLSS